MVQQIIPERRSALDTVLKGLQAASAAYGLKSEYEQNKLRQQRAEFEAQDQERKKKEDEAADLKLKALRKNVFLSEQGVTPTDQFNEKYVKVDEGKLEKTLQNLGDYPVQPIRMRVENPQSETGYDDVIAIPREDIKLAQNLKLQKANLGMEQRKMEMLAGKTTTPKPAPTAGTFTAAGFAERIAMANDNFDQLEDVGFDRASLGTSLLANLTQHAGEIGEGFKTEELKIWEQSARNFVNAVLRRESGAAISPTEFDNAAKQYFPMANDSELVKEQKRRNRQIVYDALVREAQYGLTGEIKPILHNAQMNIAGTSTSFRDRLKPSGILPKAIATPQQETDSEFLNRYIGGQ